MGGRAAGELRIHRACGMSDRSDTPTRSLLTYSAVLFGWLASSHISLENPTKDIWLEDETQDGWGLPRELRRLFFLS